VGRRVQEHGALSVDPRAPGDRPRRILALDGGGIRGVITLGVLSRVEEILRERRGDPELVLADEYDLIAGTSTGAIIAACLSWGMDVASVLAMYRAHGPMMFRPSRPWQRFRARYRAHEIAEMFRSVFVEDDGSLPTLGTSKLRTTLLVVMRNATTGSAWPLTNNPDAAFNAEGTDGRNLDIPLWKLLRASTAAPTFFPPERITLGSKTFTFIDGGVTPYNNPALVALLTATLPEYRLGWETGEDRISLLSVGTGASRVQFSTKPIERLNLVDHLRYLPPALIGSIGEEQDKLCRFLGRCVFGDDLDLEVGALKGHGPLDGSRLCTYARLNPKLDAFVRMDDVTLIDEFEQLGREYAERELTPNILV